MSKCAERTKAVTRKKRTLFTSLEEYFETTTSDDDDDDAEQSFRLPREKRREKSTALRENVGKAERATERDGIEEKIKNCR